MLVCEVKSPDTGTGSNVKDAADLGAFLARRGDSESVVKAQKPDLMLQI